MGYALQEEIVDKVRPDFYGVFCFCKEKSFGEVFSTED